MNELTRVATWLYSLLAPVALAQEFSHTEDGQTVTRVREGVAPDGWPFPYILFQHQAPGNDVSTLEGRVWATPLYLVKAVAETGSWAALAATADEIDRRLHKAKGTVDGYAIESRRERPFSLIEHPGNVEHRHLGGFYRIRI